MMYRFRSDDSRPRLGHDLYGRQRGVVGENLFIYMGGAGGKV